MPASLTQHTRNVEWKASRVHHGLPIPMATAEIIFAKLAAKEVEQIKKLVRAAHYLNVSDFVRAAGRDKLAEVRLIHERPTDAKEAGKEILRYLREHGEAYPSNIAAELGLDLSVTMRAVQGLVKEGRIE